MTLMSAWDRWLEKTLGFYMLTVAELRFFSDAGYTLDEYFAI